MSHGPEVTCQKLFEVFAQTETYQVPTLVVLRAKTIPGYVEEAKDDELARLPPTLRTEWLKAATRSRSRPQEWFRKRQQTYRDELWLVAELQKNRIPILAGSDTGNPFIFPGLSLHQELEELVRAGLTPRQALLAATHHAVHFLGLSADHGKIARGFKADLLLLRANPLEKISNTRKIEAVISRGRLLIP